MHESYVIEALPSILPTLHGFGRTIVFRVVEPPIAHGRSCLELAHRLDGLTIERPLHDDAVAVHMAMRPAFGRCPAEL